MSSALKRLAKEYRELTDNPIPGVAACPNEDDMMTWHANISLPLTLSSGEVTVPMHIVIVFKEDYPASPPNAGFAVHFPYRMGASHTGSAYNDGKHLAGTQIICLDILGNFSGIHTEWASQKGSGWSPAYSVSTLLLNLQALLLELDQSLSVHEKQQLVLTAKAYTATIGDDVHTYESPYPPFEEQWVTLEPEQVSHQAEPALARCYFTLASHQEDTLGYGVYFDRGKPKSFGELISWSAFHDQGLRQTSQKEVFTHFVPAFINPHHASGIWLDRMRTSLVACAAACGGGHGGGAVPSAPLVVLPALINSMVVEINKGDKASAISFFEALCSFWRSLRHCVVTDAALHEEATATVGGFIASSTNRHKRVVPDVGSLLALATALIDTFEREQFVDAYLDESLIRSVMWWRSECAAESGPVFGATAVSRSIFLFQLEVLRSVVGDDPNATSAAMDASNGRVPERLDALQRAWKERSEPRTWEEYALATGCSAAMRQWMRSDSSAWIHDCVQRSIDAGPLYQRGSKGKGKGKGQGKGEGGKGGRGDFDERHNGGKGRDKGGGKGGFGGKGAKGGGGKGGGYGGKGGKGGKGVGGYA